VRLLLRCLPAIVPALLGVACQSSPPPADEETYGDPVGVQLSASEAVPAFEIALALSRGVEPGPLVAPLSTLLLRAFKACPEFVRANAAGGVTQIVLSIDQGKVAEAGASGEHPDPCLASTLRGQPLEPLPAGAPPRLRALAQIRLAAAPKPPEDP